MTRAECAWGNGSDVALLVDYDPADPEGCSSVFLKADDARRLAAELLVAAERAEALDKAIR